MQLFELSTGISRRENSSWVESLKIKSNPSIQWDGDVPPQVLLLLMCASGAQARQPLVQTIMLMCYEGVLINEKLKLNRAKERWHAQMTSSTLCSWHAAEPYWHPLWIQGCCSSAFLMRRPSQPSLPRWQEIEASCDIPKVRVRDLSTKGLCSALVKQMLAQISVYPDKYVPQTADSLSVYINTCLH